MKKTQTVFYLSDEVITALKMKAVQEKKRYSELAEKLLREGLGLGLGLKETKI